MTLELREAVETSENLNSLDIGTVINTKAYDVNTWDRIAFLVSFFILFKILDP